MEILNLEAGKVETVNEKPPETMSQSELDDMLGLYQKPLKNEPTKLQSESPSVSQEQNQSQTSLPPPTQSGDKDAPFGRYKSGAKAGQPKPSPKGFIKPLDNAITEDAELSGDIIDGVMFVMVIDLLIPILIAWLNNANSKTKVSPDDLSLTDKQQNKVGKIFEKAMKNINFKANPGWLLLVAVVGLYGMNFMRVKMEAEMKTKTK